MWDKETEGQQDALAAALEERGRAVQEGALLAGGSVAQSHRQAALSLHSATLSLPERKPSKGEGGDKSRHILCFRQQVHYIDHMVHYIDRMLDYLHRSPNIRQNSSSESFIS